MRIFRKYIPISAARIQQTYQPKDTKVKSHTIVLAERTAVGLSMKRELILLAGSNATARSLEDLIIPAGYEFSTVGSQEAGLRVAQERRVSVFLVEVEAADLQCCSALLGIKTLPFASRPRLIFLIGGGAGDRARGLNLGANDVLSAPWDPSELLARLEVQLREKSEIGVL